MNAPTCQECEFTGPRQEAIDWGERRKRELLLAGAKSIRVDMQSLTDGTLRLSLVPDATPPAPRSRVA